MTPRLLVIPVEMSPHSNVIPSGSSSKADLDQAD